LRRTLPALFALALGLVVPATALAAQQPVKQDEKVTEFMLLLIGGLILLGVLIAAIEAKRSK
jgi:hypothetical protein